MSMGMSWVQLRGYSIESRLKVEGLSFDAFDLIASTYGASATSKLKKKVIGRLGKELSRDYEEEASSKLASVQHGCYVIALGGQFQLSYTLQPSRVVYIGSGEAFKRLKSHLSGKLFDFAGALRNVPLRFFICDLTDGDAGKIRQRQLEQALLDKFRSEFDPDLPLLNKSNATTKKFIGQWGKSWDKPLHKDRGPNVANWLLQPTDTNVWKGVL